MICPLSLHHPETAEKSKVLDLVFPGIHTRKFILLVENTTTKSHSLVLVCIQPPAILAKRVDRSPCIPSQTILMVLSNFLISNNRRCILESEKSSSWSWPLRAPLWHIKDGQILSVHNLVRHKSMTYTLL
jgi:hypothetical protein